MKRILTVGLLALGLRAAAAERNKSSLDELIQAAGGDRLPAAVAPRARAVVAGFHRRENVIRPRRCPTDSLGKRARKPGFLRAATTAGGGAMCDYSLSLESDPNEKALYLAQVAALNWAPPAFNDPLDTMTRDCLYCHDGAAAGDADVVMPGESPGNRPSAHAIGMVYYTGNSNTPEYKSPAEISMSVPNMRFIQSKVGCLSCHDPLNHSAANHLVVPNNASRLCYSCHIK